MSPYDAARLTEQNSRRFNSSIIVGNRFYYRFYPAKEAWYENKTVKKVKLHNWRRVPKSNLPSWREIFQRITLGITVEREKNVFLSKEWS